MWSNFEAKCVKVVSFSILHDFAFTDVDALRLMLIYQSLLKLVLKRKFSNSLLFWDKYLLKRSKKCVINKYAVHGDSAPAMWITKLKDLFDKFCHFNVTCSSIVS